MHHMVNKGVTDSPGLVDYLNKITSEMQNQSVLSSVTKTNIYPPGLGGALGAYMIRKNRDSTS